MRIVEVGPRDGLQNAPAQPTSLRAELVRRLGETGLDRIEAVSFVRAERVPQMAGAEEVVASRPPGAGICGLVLNERGFERLLAAGLTDARFTFAASDAFNRANANASTDDGLSTARRILGCAKQASVRAGIVIATSFGCPFTGEVDPRIPLTLAEQLAAAGADEIVFADTIGVAAPREVRQLLRSATGLGVPLGVHLHNTRNTGYANAYAALEAGAASLDASVGGLGGCPFAPGATGNIATEDLLYLLDREGVETGVDIDAVIGVARWLEEATGLSLDGHLHRLAPFPPPQLPRRAARAAERNIVPTTASAGSDRVGAEPCISRLTPASALE